MCGEFSQVARCRPNLKRGKGPWVIWWAGNRRKKSCWMDGDINSLAERNKEKEGRDGLARRPWYDSPSATLLMLQTTHDMLP